MSPETTQVAYEHRKLVALLMKDQGIHEGHWILAINFGLAAGNVAGDPARPGVFDPTAFLAIQSVGLARAPSPGPATYDASELNPASPS